MKGQCMGLKIKKNKYIDTVYVYQIRLTKPHICIIYFVQFFVSLYILRFFIYFYDLDLVQINKQIMHLIFLHIFNIF